jgi:hypothetical protein
MKASPEELASYLGLIRFALSLPPAADPLDELEARLKPGDPSARPPARAPGIVRLRRALTALRRRTTPDVSLDVLAEDLRFLHMFSDDRRTRWPDDALRRLLGDVQGAPSSRVRRSKPAATPKVVPLERPEDA